MRDLINNIHTVTAIPPVAARTDNTPIVSAIIDLKGYDSAAFVILIGTNTDTNATFAATVDEGDASDLTGSNAVAAADLTGTLAQAGFQFDDDTETRKIGYVGSRRFIRLTITPSGNDAGNIFLAAVAVLGNPVRVPTANPPQ